MTDEEVSRCAEELKLFYRERMCKIKPDPFVFNLIFQFEEIYTELTLLRNEMGITKKKGSLNYKDLLTTTINGEAPKRLLVEGEGGVGKTTLCSKIAWDWTNGSEAYNHFSWVLVIPLGNVIKGETIGDIIKNYLDDNNNVSPEQIENYMKSHPSKVLIILDGFDEYNGDLLTDDSSDISQILRLKMLKQCIVLVTTRPWRASQIKCNLELNRSYCFIAAEGFSSDNVSKYIRKFFANDRQSRLELLEFIQGNDVIKNNMAPFPIYVAMLCVLWKDIGIDKRERIRKLETFSKLFEQIIIFLRDHYLSKLKSSDTLNEEQLNNEVKMAQECFQQIGSVAFTGLLEKKLDFKVDDFSSCKDAIETCCRIGVLSIDQKQVSRWKKSVYDSQPQAAKVFFPHKLFQEYVAALYLASIHVSDHEEYYKLQGKVLGANVLEFRYLLYFTAALGKEVGRKIVNQIQLDIGIDSTTRHSDVLDLRSPRLTKMENFLIDVTFEAFDKDTAKTVGQRIFAEKRALTIDEEMSVHTVSGCVFIMEQHTVEKLELKRDCGPTVSRDIADQLSSPTSLTTLKLLEMDLDDTFYSVILDNVSKVGKAINKVQELHIDDRFIGGLRKFDATIKTIFPNLKRLTFRTNLTVSPKTVKQLTHNSLEELSICKSEAGLHPVPFIGEPLSLGQLFSDSFPQLISLVFKELMMGILRIRSLLQNLRKHPHLKSISIFACFTDDELDPLVEQITAENRIKVTLQHDEGQRKLEFKLSEDVLDALCHRPSVCEMTVTGQGECYLCFADHQCTEVDSKSPYFMENKHIRILEKWSGWRNHQQRIQGGSSATPRSHSKDEPSQDEDPSGQTNLPCQEQEFAIPSDPVTDVQSELGSMSLSTAYPPPAHSALAHPPEKRNQTTMNIVSSGSSNVQGNIMIGQQTIHVHYHDYAGTSQQGCSDSRGGSSDELTQGPNTARNPLQLQSKSKSSDRREDTGNDWKTTDERPPKKRRTETDRNPTSP
ncbi:uncharacterized protein LOC121421189 [Lytechinus variegatus]|uniref:uncharacterized protein LOC121421189 n=1 Tax=Lytechinus variegatus TaxID=7654 RepID=UPI001BB2AA16|nr:uncharacterized protein LOC121421189 [Lytechinus variegatus]